MTETEYWVRDDGWDVSLTRLGERIILISRLPLNTAISTNEDFTYSNVKQVLLAHGYEKVNGY